MSRSIPRLLMISLFLLLATGAAAQAQTIAMNAIPSVGAGLQGVLQSATLSLSQHGGVTVHVESTDPLMALVSPNPTTPGAASFDTFVPNGSTGVTFVVHGLEGVTGTATISASAPGFTGTSRPVTIAQPAVDINSLLTTLDTLDPIDPFQVRVGLPASGNTVVSPVQVLRVGGPGLTATLTNSNAVVGELETTPVTGQTVTVSIAPGNSSSASSVATGGVAFDGLAVGTTTVSVTIPGFIQTTAAAQNVAVTQPIVTLGTISNVGSGLQGGNLSVALSATQHGGVTVHLESSNPSVALISPNASTPGTAFIDIPLANGVAATAFVVSGLEGVTGTSTITATAPGFTSANRTATIVQPAVDLISLNSTIDTLDPNDPFQIRVGLPGTGNAVVSPAQSVRAGSPGVVATVVNSNAPVGELITTPLSADAVVVTIPAGSSTSGSSVAAGGVDFDGTALGSTTVSAQIPGFITTTAASFAVTVTQPVISVNPLSPVGSGLQGLATSIGLSASQHGGVMVRVRSANPSLALVSPTTSTAGTDSFDVFLANGLTATSFVVHGLESTTGVATIVFSAPGFTGTSRPITIAQPALDIIGLNSSIDTLDPRDDFQVRVGLAAGSNGSVNPSQQLRTGGPGVTAQITHSNSPIGDLVTTALTADAVTVTLAAGAFLSPSTVATGGVAFDGIAVGSTTVSATIPGFIATTAASQTVNVTQPTIAINAIGPVGAGLQGSPHTITLSVTQHGGVTVHVESTDPSIARVSPNASTAGTPSYDIVVANGTATTSVVVHGMENVTGTSNIVVSAPGFVGTSQVATIVQPALDIAGLATTLDANDPNDPFQVRVGLPNSGNGQVNPPQVVRTGSAGLTATLTLGNGVAGQLVTTSASNDTVVVSIAAGSSSSPTSVATGGVAFDPLAVGNTLVAARIPGFLPTGTATQNVAVTDRIVTLGGIENVGAGLQSAVVSVQLGLPQHGGVTLHVESDNPAVALLSPGFSTPGSASLDFPLANGSTTVSFYVHGITTGTATITASAPTFTSAIRTATVVDPALEISLLDDSLDVFDPNDPFVVRVGTPLPGDTALESAQFVRAGGSPLTATLTSSDPAVAALVTASESGSPVTVTISPGELQSGTSAAAGGVELDPTDAGTTLVAATIPGFIATDAASQSVVVVTQPVPTMVQSFGAAWDDRRFAVRVYWRLADIAPVLEFEILRREGDGLYARIEPAVERARDEFHFVDESAQAGRTYRYRVAVMEAGDAVASFESDVTTPRLELTLAQNHPNPFNPGTRIRFTVPDAARVSVAIYDVRGNRVATLVERVMPAGMSEVEWDGRDAAGSPVSSGMYFYKLTAGNRSLTRKMVLLK